MAGVLLVSRVVLSCVFAIAGTAKLINVRGTEEAAMGLGTPRRIAPFVARALPLVELGLVIPLLSVSLSWWAAIGAGGLLVCLTAVVGANLAVGRHPNCNCFGSLSGGPITWRTFLRNLAMLALAVLIIWQGRDSPELSLTDWLGELSLGEQLLLSISAFALLLLALQAWVLTRLLVQNGRLLLRLEAIEQKVSHSSIEIGRASGTGRSAKIGSEAPDFVLPDQAGTRVSLSTLLIDEKPLLLFFLDPACGSCTEIAPDIVPWRRRYRSLRFATMTTATEMR